MTEFASIPEPSAEVDSLYETVAALKQTVEALVGRRGTDESTAVTRQELADQANLAFVDKPLARANLELSSSATLPDTTWFKVANNLSEGTAATMRANLGLAYGKQSFVIWADGWKSLGGAAPGTLTDSAGQPWATLDFDQATDEHAIAVVPMPKGADLTAVIQFHVYWSASAGAGTVNWTINATSLGDDDALGQAYNTGSAVTDTLLATSDMHISPEAGGLVLTSGGASPQAHDMLKLQLMRDVSEDTLNADARLIAVKFTYTVNAGNDN